LVDGSAFFLQAILGILLLVSYHPYFILFGIIITTMIWLDWKLFGPRGVAAGTPEGNGKYEVVSWMEDIGRSRQFFMSEKGRKFAMDRLHDKMSDWLELRNNLFTQQFKQGVGLQIIYAVVYGGLIFLGGMLVLKKELSLGQLVAATIVVSLILSNLSKLQNFFLSIYDYSTSLDEMAIFYDHPLERHDDNLPGPQDYKVELQNVTLEPNFNFNLKLESGLKYFIFIGSFSAKDHLIELVMGFFNPKSGKILIDDKLIEDYDLAKVRNEIELVTLNNFFNGTILENLESFDKKKFTKTEIENTLNAVGLLENVKELNDGLNTIIQPNGYPLSTSQLITLHFAKIILNKPKFLIVTNDFERISEAKRKRILPIITDKNAPWTLLFFSHKKTLGGNFDKFTILRRRQFEEFKDFKTLEEAVEKYEQNNLTN
jgi:putative ABC transport system ATP-binding protein